MADYKAIKGHNIQTVAGDPDPLQVGDIWYSSTTKKIRGAKLPAGAWASGGALNNGRHDIGGGGTQTAGIAFGGQTTPPATYHAITETYNPGGTAWQAVKTSGFTAVAGQGYFCNTTSSAFTATLPAGTIGDEISFIDYAGTFDSYNLTVDQNGSEKIHGSTDALTVATERAAFTLVFTDSTQGWLLKDK